MTKCLVCGKEFNPKADHWYRKQKYCSQACYKKFRTVMKKVTNQWL